jgi:general secretion pathway protein K
LSAPARGRSERGAALLLVLWAAILLSAILAMSIAAARADARRAAAALQHAKAMMAIDAALDAAMLKIVAEESRAETILEDFRLNGFSVRVEWSAETTKLDLNLATETAIRDFFIERGEPPQRADALAAAIADWRDEDDLKRPNGAEAPDYAGAEGQRIGNRPFHAAEEISAVLGVAADDAPCLAAAMTVFGDPTFKRGDSASESSSYSALIGASVSSSAAGKIVALRSVAAPADGDKARYSREAAFRITRNEDGLFERIAYGMVAGDGDACDP